MFDKLQKSLKTTINMMDGYKSGTLIVDDGRIELELENGTVIKVQPIQKIEILNDNEYIAITYNQALNQMTDECSPLFAGMYARIK